MTRLFIEGVEVDITTELSQQVTFAIDDIRKIEAKATTYSKTIVLPGSQKNNNIFGNIYELTRGNDVQAMGANSFYNFDPTRSATAQLFVNGLLIMKGVARLLAIRRQGEAIEYEIALFGELGGFISSIGTKRLEDLDFSEYDFTWDEAEIRSTWNPANNTATGGDINGPFSSVIYNPPIDYIQVLITGRIAWLQPNDDFEISGTTFNNGTFTVYDIIYNSGTNQTKIIIQILPGQPFTPETGNVTISKAQNFGVGPVFPLIDYGVNDPVGFPLNQDFRNFRPALFVREYMSKIISGAGFTYESNFFDTPLFRRLVIPNNDGNLEKRGATIYVEATSDNTAYQNNYSGTQILFNENVPIDFNNIVTLTNFSVGAIGPATSGLFRYVGATTASVKFYVKLDFYVTAPFMVDIIFKLVRKRSNTFTDIAVAPGLRRGFSGRFTFDLQVSATIEPADEYNVEFLASYRQTRTPYPVGSVNAVGIETLVTSLKIEQDPPGWIPYAYGETIEVNKTIPKNILQKDFFVSIVKMFNLMITEDPVRDKHLKITPYIDFHNPDPASYIDWSYKVARDKPWLIKPMSEANARTYDFKYKEDNDYFNESYKKKWAEVYGNKTFDNRLEFSKERAAIDLIFSPSVLVGYQDEDKIFPAIYKYDVNANKKTPQGHNIRIMQIKYFDDVEGWQIYNGPNPASGTITDYLYCGHYDNPIEPLIDINWGVVRELFYTLPTTGNLENNLFFLFYSPYMAEIIDRDSKLLTCETYLNEGDIEKIDFSRFIIIDGALFRLQKVIDWTTGELNKTELLRVINTTYPLPAPVSGGLFRLVWTDVTQADAWIGGDRTDVEDWNAFFNLPQGGIYQGKFSKVFIEDNTVTLVGYCTFSMQLDKFKNCQYIKAIYDDLGCVIELRQQEFYNCQNLEEARFKNLYKITSPECFAECVNLISFKAPTMVSMNDRTFQKCYAIRYFDFSNLGRVVNGTQPTDFCGIDLNDNGVFDQITGNNITLLLPLSTSQQADVDFDILTTNNNVQIILT